MTQPGKIAGNCNIPASAVIHPEVSISDRVVLAGDGIVIGFGARLDAASVIAEHVTIGQGAWVRTGAVVLKSVPPNAIVEGNPAQVVGYRSALQSAQIPRPAPFHFDIHQFDEAPRPSKVPLGIGESSLYLMRRITDARGSLTVGEVPTEVPFLPKRYFVVFDVPSVELRGEHAHKRCQQFLICLNGSCRVLLDDGTQSCEVTLDRPDMGVFMPEMIWGTQYRYSDDAVLMVFASHPYETDDYLRTYDEFLAERERLRS
ncbi:WxcM-like domain-containing protein [Sulfitobacter sp. JB4-11]|uniref:WxcM-like domain-containing protein n=1 Tax=Sulfitobacter rhodophyticola TaxID=3238304 RepID=UPI003513B417